LSVSRPYIINDKTISECEAVGGMRTGKGNQSTQRKPAPVQLCPLQFPQDLTWDWTWTVVVGQWAAPDYMLTRCCNPEDHNVMLHFCNLHSKKRRKFCATKVALNDLEWSKLKWYRMILNYCLDFQVTHIAFSWTVDVLRYNVIFSPKHQCCEYSIANNTFWVTLPYSVSSFILLFSVWKL
jgi:hypothetical protein